jgi:hypothetical protein
MLIEFGHLGAEGLSRYRARDDAVYLLKDNGDLIICSDLGRRVILGPQPLSCSVLSGGNESQSLQLGCNIGDRRIL